MLKIAHYVKEEKAQALQNAKLVSPDTIWTPMDNAYLALVNFQIAQFAKKENAPLATKDTS